MSKAIDDLVTELVNHPQKGLTMRLFLLSRQIYHLEEHGMDYGSYCEVSETGYEIHLERGIGLVEKASWPERVYALPRHLRGLSGWCEFAFSADLMGQIEDNEAQIERLTERNSELKALMK